MKKETKTFEILSIKRGNLSYYGNPSYFLGLADSDGNIYYAKTASNASIAYSIGSHWENTKKTLKYHFTKMGSMIVDYLVKE